MKLHDNIIDFLPQERMDFPGGTLPAFVEMSSAEEVLGHALRVADKTKHIVAELDGPENMRTVAERASRQEKIATGLLRLVLPEVQSELAGLTVVDGKIVIFAEL